MNDGTILVSMLIIGLVIGLFSGLYLGSISMSSSKLIEPTLEIVIANGVSDTTFVYRPNKKI